MCVVLPMSRLVSRQGADLLLSEAIAADVWHPLSTHMHICAVCVVIAPFDWCAAILCRLPRLDSHTGYKLCQKLQTGVADDTSVPSHTGALHLSVPHLVAVCACALAHFTIDSKRTIRLLAFP